MAPRSLQDSSPTTAPCATTARCPPTRDAAAVGAALSGLVTDVLTDARDADLEVAEVVGIGSAGPVDTTTGTVHPVNIVSLRGFPLVDHVAAAATQALGRPVRAALAQDGQCFAAAEQWIGAAAGSPR